MTPRLRTLSGTQVVRILEAFGFAVVSTRGSHAKLRREVTDTGETQVLTIPLHKQLAPGTLRAIFRQASRFIPEDAMRDRFYSP